MKICTSHVVADLEALSVCLIDESKSSLKLTTVQRSTQLGMAKKKSKLV